jgi:hypothetical protein
MIFFFFLDALTIEGVYYRSSAKQIKIKNKEPNKIITFILIF